ncbi:MAG: glycosyltransferase [Candidatus Paceibacterota bacterium]|jgi:glycosyltransferase involved in cell wall biosynthesis/O-antigen/teichoic acid export membrane protein|nr:glycosyltransferase [Candidatus Paceibacterota bacterium]
MKFTARFFSADILKRAVSRSTIFLAAGMIGNILNFLFNLYLGRELSSADYALFAFFTSILYIAGIFFTAVSNAVNHSLADPGSLRKRSMHSLIFVSFLFSILWVLASPTLARAFNIKSVFPIILFTPVFFFGTVIAVGKGVLQESLSFGRLGVLFIGETIIKFIAALIIIWIGVSEAAYLSLPISFAAIYVFIIFSRSSQIKEGGQGDFPMRFFNYTLIAGLSTMVFLSVDILLVKGFFEPDMAGSYALLALSGKMLFFFGNLLSAFMIPLVIREKSGDLNARPFIRFLFIGSYILTLGAALFFLIFGGSFMNLLFGEKAALVIPLLPLYTLAIAAFTLSSLYVMYHLARKEYVFSVISIISSFVLVAGLFVSHKTLADVVGILFSVSAINFIVIIILHVSYTIKYVRNEGKMEMNVGSQAALIPTDGIRSVTIGIPAYNEERNIGHLIEEILRQETAGFRIEKIIVASDGSKDGTVRIARAYENRGVFVIDDPVNRGKNYRQNQILKETSSDILVILDGDIILENNVTLAKLMAPIWRENADLTSGSLTPLRGKTFIEKVLVAGFRFKFSVYRNYRSGNNLYTCLGGMRAFSRKYYTAMTFPEISAGEDQYSYFFCVARGMKYRFAEEARALFKLPDTFSDYKKYALRIFRTQRKHADGDEFSTEMIQGERHLPIGTILREAVSAFLHDPFHLPAYVMLHILMQFWSDRQPKETLAAFHVSETTKNVRSENETATGEDKKKTIIFSSFGDYDQDAPAGTEIAVHETAKRLVSSYHIKVITSKIGGRKNHVIDGVEYVHIGIWFGGLKIMQIMYLFLLPWYAKILHYDAWVEGFTGPISTAFLPLFSKKPIIGATHFFNGVEMREKYHLPFDIIERWGVKHHRNLAVLSEMQKMKASEMNSEAEIRIITNGFNNELLSLERRPMNFPKIVFMGRIDMHSKGLDFLFGAFSKILLRFPDARLILAGTGTLSDIEAAIRVIEMYGIGDHVDFLGNVSGEAKLALLSEATVFVHASRFETFGISVLEALAAGIPTVVFDIPGLGWIPNGAIRKAAPYEIAAFSDEVEWLLVNSKNAEEMGRKGREFSRVFTWDAVALQYKKFFEDIIK